LLRTNQAEDKSESESEYPSDLESNSDDILHSPFSDRPPNMEAIKPLSEVNDVYKPPRKLELPQCDSALSMDSSVSSGRSTPDSTVSASAMDSEADFARLAENLALKSDGKVY
jgi:hypothetical protein